MIKPFHRPTIDDHGVAGFLSRSNGAKGFLPYTVKEISMQMHMPINYRQDDGRVIRFYNEHAVVSTPDRIVVSVVNRKYPKEG